MHSRRIDQWPALFLLVMCIIFASSGCIGSLTPSWHQKYGWKAEKYFDDPQVVALCKAIEADDLAEVDRLIEAGANVKAQGKGNMTPLLWAFPENKPAIFKRLLEAGADPNVIVESDFNTRHTAIIPGDSVTHMAAKSSFPQHFRYVMEHGGDPNLLQPQTKNTVLSTVIVEGAPYTRDRIKLLVEKGVDLDQPGRTGAPPVITAVNLFGQYDIALMLLEAGADPNVYIENQNKKLVHMVALAKKGLATSTPQQKADFHKLVDWLEAHGQSIAEAEADYERWKKWTGPTAEKAELMRAEIAERKAREKAANEDE